MSFKLEKADKEQYQLQAVVVKDQANPAQNTWYTVFDRSAGDFLIDWCAVKINTTNETLENRMTIDGIACNPVSLACNFGTIYYCYHIIDEDAQYSSLTATEYLAEKWSSLPCRSFKFEIRKTTATGAGTLEGSVAYHKRGSQVTTV